MKHLTPQDMELQYSYDEIIELVSLDFGRRLPIELRSPERLVADLPDQLEKVAKLFRHRATLNKIIIACETDKELEASIREMEFRLWALMRTVALVCGDEVYAPEPEPPILLPPPPSKAEVSKPTGSYTQQAGTLVYVARSLTGQVLYVGVTDSLFARMTQHSRLSRWWDTMETLSWEEWPDRESALRQETRLIVRHRPLFNTVHNPDRRRPM